MRMKQYESYKDSGIQWLGNIPSHWKIQPLKYNLSLKGRIGWNGLKSDEFKEVSYAYLVTGQDFKGAVVDWSNCYQIDQVRYEEDPFIQLNNGDLLVTKDGTIGKVAKVTNLDKPACLNSGIFVVKQTKDVFDQGFLYWTFVSDQLGAFNNSRSTGSTIQHLYQNVFEDMPLLLPPLSEQRIIASYLDNKISQIDAIIGEKEKMVEDLQNYRKSLISETVTRGLNPDVPMKDSGIEWIGKIPEHWQTLKTSYLFDEIGSGTTPNTNDESFYNDDGINWLQTGDLNDGYIEKTSKHISNLAFENHSALHIYPIGSLVIAMYGATIGKVGILNIETTTNQACCVLAKPKNILVKYVYYAYIASKQSLVNLGYGGGQPNISQSLIRSHKLPVPPEKEQQTIIAFLDIRVNKIQESISELQSQIEDLKSYKSSVITEAVTGKVDLRNL